MAPLFVWSVRCCLPIFLASHAILTFDNERSTRHSSLNMSCFERCKIAVQSNLAALQSSQIWLRKYNILGIGLEFLYEINAAGPTPGKMTLVADKTRGI